MDVSSLTTAISSALPTTTELAENVSANKTAIIAGAVGVGVGSVLGGAAVAAVSKSSSSKKRKKSKKRKSSSRKKSKNNNRRGKRKSRSTKKIHYTKKGQPYVLMSSGKARFISKRSAKSSKKRKGGRY
jgi:hypothetical protein